MWFEKIKRINGIYYVIESHKNKDSSLIEADKINKRIRLEKNNFHIRLKTEISRWKIAQPTQYLSAYGITNDKANHHLVFTFDQDDIKFFIPSLVIINTIFSPPSRTFRYLFDLNGFYDLCHPQMRAGKFSCDLNHEKARSERQLNRINWIFAFPTAYNAWKSVYRFLRDGTIGVDLPDAEITCLFRGNRIRNSAFINQIRILSINPTEDPINWAKMKRKEFRFNFRTGRNKGHRVLSDMDLMRKDGTSRLSNSEWTEIKEILFTYLDRTPRITRTRIDSLLHKLTSGLLWREIENSSLIILLYRKLRHDNLWPKIRTILLRHRKNRPATDNRGDRS